MTVSFHISSLGSNNYAPQFNRGVSGQKPSGDLGVFKLDGIEGKLKEAPHLRLAAADFLKNFANSPVLAGPAKSGPIQTLPPNFLN